MKNIMLFMVCLSLLIGCSDKNIDQQTLNEKDDHSEFDIESIHEQILSNTCQLLIMNENVSSYMIIFEDMQIKMGVSEGGYDSVVYYDHLEYNPDEKSFLFHINGERIFNDQGEVEKQDLDYFDKITIEDDVLSYYYKYDSDEMLESKWQLIKK